MPSPASPAPLLLARYARSRILLASSSYLSSPAPSQDKQRFLNCDYKYHQTFEDNRNRDPKRKIPLLPACCFAATGLLAFSTMPSEPVALYLEEENSKAIEASTFSAPIPRIFFVLGGPGSGKGTQCANLVERYGFTHVSAGDLLRGEIKSGSEDGEMIRNMINDGKIVPSEVTVKLLQKAMKESGNTKFLIDGFPRNDENRSSFENITGIQPEFVLYFDCPEEEMEHRLLSRNQGREDDNQETIKNRFRVFRESTLPVVQYYESKEKVKKIDASGTIEEVAKSLHHIFVPFLQENLLQLTRDLLRSIDKADYDTYSRLCHSDLTAFEPESKGHLVEGLEFHKFYFDSNSLPYARSDISSAKVVLIGDNVGIVMYTRLCQYIGGINNVNDVKPFNETRVWERKKNSNGQWEWKNIHFHRSKAPVL